MSRMPLSAKIDMAAFNRLVEIANKSFDGNKSRALDWILYSVMKPGQFHLFMARYHASQMTHFKRIADSLRKDGVVIFK